MKRMLAIMLAMTTIAWLFSGCRDTKQPEKTQMDLSAPTAMAAFGGSVIDGVSLAEPKDLKIVGTSQIETVSVLVGDNDRSYKFAGGRGYAGEVYYVQKLEAGEGKVFAENAVLDLTYRIANADPLGYVTVESSVDGINYNEITKFDEATGDDAYSNDIRRNAMIELGGTADAQAVWVKIKMQHWTAPAGAAVDCSTITAAVKDAPTNPTATVVGTLDFAQLTVIGENMAAVAEDIKALGAEDASNLITFQNGDYKCASGKGYAGEGYFVQKLEAGEGKVFAADPVLNLTYRITNADPLGYVTVESSVDGIRYNACATFNEVTGDAYTNEARKNATVDLGCGAGAAAIWVKVKMQHWTGPDGAAVDCSRITASVEDAPEDLVTTVVDTLDFAQMSVTGEDMAAVEEAIKALGAEAAANLICNPNGDYKFVGGKGYSGEGYFVQKLEAGEGKVFTEAPVLDLTYRITNADPLGYVTVESSVDGIFYDECATFTEATGNSYSNEARKDATVNLNCGAGEEAVWVRIKVQHWTSPDGAAVDFSRITGYVENAPAGLPPVEQWNLKLGDSIGAEFVLNATEEQIASGTVTYTVSGTTTTKNLADLVNDEGKAVLSVKLAAAQMSEEVEITLGESTKSYSVRKYAQYILDGEYSAETKNLVKHMLNYGAASQTYFAYNTGRLANVGIEVEPATVPTESVSLNASGAVEGVKFYGASLVFLDKIAVRFYFAGDVSGCTFTANGNGYDPIAKDNLYYIEIADIMPQDLEQVLTVTVADGTSEMSVSYAPVNYIVRMYAKGTQIAPVVQALYGYYLAAESYTGEEAADQVEPMTYPEAAVKTLNASNMNAFVNRANDEVNYKGYKHQDGTNLAVSPYYTATVEGKVLPVYATPVFVCTTQTAEVHSFRLG